MLTQDRNEYYDAVDECSLELLSVSTYSLGITSLDASESQLVKAFRNNQVLQTHVLCLDYLVFFCTKV